MLKRKSRGTRLGVYVDEGHLVLRERIVDHPSRHPGVLAFKALLPAQGVVARHSPNGRSPPAGAARKVLQQAESVVSMNSGAASLGGAGMIADCGYNDVGSDIADAELHRNFDTPLTAGRNPNAHLVLSNTPRR